MFKLNIVGFPASRLTESLKVEVQIINNKKEVIGRYMGNVTNSNYLAMYWGYNWPRLYRKVTGNNAKTALEKIRIKINNDSTRLNKQLK
jgi:hypothetical protein